MRPIRLSMQAFGAFVQLEEIDFRKLGTGSLFLISGPTGAGKSTLLDAMCYALYGDTCSEDRPGKQMRSDLAPAGLPTRVVFDFAIGEKAYRVTREPEQERPRKRGDGVTVSDPAAHLWDRTGVTEDNAEGILLASKIQTVGEKAVELLGFDSKQFRQVIVLPQGRFRELLTADSKSRERILETLFQTGFYSHIQQALKTRALGIKEDHGRLAAKRTGLLQSAGIAGTEEGKARLDGFAERVVELRTAQALLVARARERQTALEAGRDLSRKFQERDHARKQAELLRGRDGAIAQKKSELERARRAEPLAAVERNLEERAAEARKALDASESCARRLMLAEKAVSEAELLLRREKDRKPERDTKLRRIAQLEGLRDKASQFARLGADLNSAEAETHRAEALVRSAKEDRQRFRQRILELEADREALAQSVAQADNLRGQIDKLKTTLRNRTELGSAEAAIAKAQAALAKSAADLERAELAFAAAGSELEWLEARSRQGRAALLAKELAPEVPCPVCGSPHHPNPAKGDSEFPGDEEIDEKRKRLKQLETVKETARQRHRADQNALGEGMVKRTLLTEQLGPDAEAGLPELRIRLRQREAELERSLAAAKQTEKLAAELRQAGEDLQNRETLLPTLEDKQRETAMAAKELSIRLGQISEELPEALRPPGALENALAGARGEVQGLDEALAKAEEDAGRREREREAVRAGVEGARERLAEAKAGHEEARRGFEGAALSAGFADAAEYRSARREKPVMAALEAEIADHAAKRAEAEGFWARAEREIDGLAMPDLAALESGLAESRAGESAGQKALNQLETQIETLERNLKGLREIDGELAKADEDYRLYGTLSEVANGNNRFNMTLQRYVLATWLDQVLQAASHRLATVSRGRYQLQRRAGLADGRVSGGLDLEIMDEYSGKARSAGTLSGGESFLAALSLALGLADVVQSYAGGVRMETMFIDEGFGSLDPEALDQSFQALLDLQKSGRLVGIISHVEDLKQRIDVRLEVTPSRQGSSAKFVGI